MDDMHVYVLHTYMCVYTHTYMQMRIERLLLEMNATMQIWSVIDANNESMGCELQCSVLPDTLWTCLMRLYYIYYMCMHASAAGTLAENVPEH